jgi:hypothetical protein
VLEPEDFTNAAAESAARDYPNAERRGCPPAGTRSRLLGAGRLPDTDERGHLLNCSECYVEYREALGLARRVGSRPVGSPTRWTGWSRIQLAAAMMLLAGASSLAWWVTRAAMSVAPREPSVAERSIASPGVPEPTPEAPATPVAEQDRVDRPAEAAPATRSVLQPEALLTLHIDLQEPTVFRDGLGSGPLDDKGIVLPAARTRLALSLPEHSAPGAYRVTVVDAFGRELIEANGTSRSGETLAVVLDLAHVPSGPHRLCVARSDEVPDCYRALIVQPHSPGSRR